MSNVPLSEPEAPEQEHQDINVSVNPSNNNNIHDNVDNDSQSDDGTQQVRKLHSNTGINVLLSTTTERAYKSLPILASPINRCTND